MQSITKRYPGGVVANDAVSLTVLPGTAHAVVGENGAGKSTLMGVLYGSIRPDSGSIEVSGSPVTLRRPADAIRHGIGLVTQHTTMIPALTALDNVLLGFEPSRLGVLDRRMGRNRVEELSAQAGIEVDWGASADALSVAALQKAEIVKALYRGARVLILDEPTATLAPAEADRLFAVVHGVVASGASVLFITHKLREVLDHSDHVTVLRGGAKAGDRVTAETCADELVSLMLGSDRSVAHSVEATPEASRRSELALQVSSLTVRGRGGRPAVHSADLSVRAGEVLGVAGVDGSGQRELAEAVVGLRSAVSGSVTLCGEDVTARSVASRAAAGLAYVPEDRHREGLILDFDLSENLLLGRHRDASAGGGRFLQRRRVLADAARLLTEGGVVSAGATAPASSLSGGNQQKVVVARALARRPRALVAMQPTRGLDVGASAAVYDAIRARTAAGMGVLLFSLDLDELREVSDRIAVMYNGRIAGVLDRDDAAMDQLGKLMTEGRP
ncbi:MAG: ABC transporter ATP-binding protein [Armatimonadetes bacterium]|nr:ABC transporter ATP-binding protein [Armatimonadota bacterium]